MTTYEYIFITADSICRNMGDNVDTFPGPSNCCMTTKKIENGGTIIYERQESCSENENLCATALAKKTIKGGMIWQRKKVERDQEFWDQEASGNLVDEWYRCDKCDTFMLMGEEGSAGGMNPAFCVECYAAILLMNLKN